MNTPKSLLRNELRATWFSCRRPHARRDPILHHAVLACTSDYGMPGTTLLRTASPFLTRRVQAASLDHAAGFNRPCRVDDWLLDLMDAPAAAARVFTSGALFTRDGTLVASTAQQGLIRHRKNG